MSCEEIRWWMRELRRRGWNRGAMQRLLGSFHHNWRKADGKEWIYPGEQIRFSRQLKRVISGEVVLKEYESGRTWAGRWLRNQDPVLATHPEPLRMPMKMTFDFKAGRCRLTPSITPPENPLPSFKTLLDNPPKMAALKRQDPGGE